MQDYLEALLEALELPEEGEGEGMALPPPLKWRRDTTAENVPPDRTQGALRSQIEPQDASHQSAERNRLPQTQERPDSPEAKEKGLEAPKKQDRAPVPTEIRQNEIWAALESMEAALEPVEAALESMENALAPAMDGGRLDLNGTEKVLSTEKTILASPSARGQGRENLTLGEALDQTGAASGVWPGLGEPGDRPETRWLENGERLGWGTQTALASRAETGSGPTVEPPGSMWNNDAVWENAAAGARSLERQWRTRRQAVEFTQASLLRSGQIHTGQDSPEPRPQPENPAWISGRAAGDVRTVDRAFQRDARRYDGAFPLY